MSGEYVRKGVAQLFGPGGGGLILIDDPEEPARPMTPKRRQDVMAWYARTFGKRTPG